MVSARRWSARLGLAALVTMIVAPSGASVVLQQAATAATCAPAAHAGPQAPAPVWTFAATSSGESGDFTGTPVVADGCVFAGSNGGWVSATNADTGQLVWQTQVARIGAISSSVTVRDGRVNLGVANAGASKAVALDEATGVGTGTTRNGSVIAFRPTDASSQGAQEPTQPAAQVSAATRVVAGPEAQLAGYVTRVMVVTRSGGAIFYNLDIVQHNVVSTAGLFSSPLVGLGGHATIVGIQNLTPGKLYGFYCSIHPQMKGTFYVAR